MKWFTLQQIAELTDSELSGDPSYRISNVSTLDAAIEHELSFFAAPRYDLNINYDDAMRRSKAGAIFISEETKVDPSRNVLRNKNPSLAFQKAVELFAASDELTGFTGIHPTAVIHPTCVIGEEVQIGPHVVLDKEVTVGKGSIIGAGCYIGPKSCVGESCILHPHVTIRERCTIGNRVILQPGAVIGSCGFGYSTDSTGKHTKLKQLGIVIIEDDVEIGANTTIDRARFATTHIKKGSKIDNLVQIAHNVEIGEHNLLAAQTGVAGSTKTKRNVVMGGQTAVSGHIELADGVILGGRSAVSKSLKKAGPYTGHPAVPLNQYQRNAVLLRNIETYVARIASLEEKLAKISMTGIAKEPSHEAKQIALNIEPLETEV